MRIEAVSRSRFRSPGLVVTSDVLHEPHKFDFFGHSIEVKLPGECEVSEDVRKPGSIVSAGYITKKSGMRVELFQVLSIEILIELAQPIVLKKEMLQRPPVQRGLVSQKKAQYLDELTKTHESLAQKAFDYWIRVVRWKSWHWWIAQPEVIGRYAGSSTYLVEQCTGTHFWAGGMSTIGRISPSIGLDQWSRMQAALQTRKSPPVWIEFLFDAKHKLENGDNSGCKLNLAVSYETGFKHLLIKQIPDSEKVEKQLVDAIYELNIEAVRRHIKNFSFWGADSKWNDNVSWSGINDVFKLRNRIVHAGSEVNESSERLNNLVDSANKFMLILDDNFG